MITILEYTQNPLQHMGKMASICWNTVDQTSDTLKRIGKDCLISGHYRVAEFPDITIEISEYSARMIRELYVQIIGVTRLQESTRYVDCSNFSYYTPDSIKYSEPANYYYKNIMEQIQGCYQALVEDCKIPKQDVANILPLGMFTKVVLKINLRALMHMFELRLCKRALKEYRDFMIELKQSLIELDDEWEYLCETYFLPKCKIIGYCIEQHSCKLMPMKNEVIKE